ncbi:MAG: hypothetical protein NUW01_18680 [Gemmatimonadaceae bacterium]|nr:hypothetical protein [Gemmatimonadaceae bacterium]
MSDIGERIPTPSEANARAFAQALTGSDADLFVEAVQLRDMLTAGSAYQAGYIAGIDAAKTIMQGGDVLAEAERVIKEVTRDQ